MRLQTAAEETLPDAGLEQSGLGSFVLAADYADVVDRITCCS
jgi:hypothetical protein